MTVFLHFDKQMVRVQKNRADRKWDKFIMSELRGKTVGFVGFGSIAQATARLCQAFGMRILALRRSKEGPGSELADEVFSYEEARPPTDRRRAVSSPCPYCYRYRAQALVSFAPLVRTLFFAASPFNPSKLQVCNLGT